MACADNLPFVLLQGNLKVMFRAVFRFFYLAFSDAQKLVGLRLMGACGKETAGFLFGVCLFRCCIWRQNMTEHGDLGTWTHEQRSTRWSLSVKRIGEGESGQRAPSKERRKWPSKKKRLGGIVHCLSCAKSFLGLIPSTSSPQNQTKYTAHMHMNTQLTPNKSTE